MPNSSPDLPSISAVDGGQHQSAARTELILSVLARASESGLRLQDVAEQTALTKATAHRLLSGLVAYGLVDLDERSGRYFLGMKLFGWASGVADRFGLRRITARALRRLADRFEDAIYLLVRKDDEAVCVERLEGAFPIKSLALEIGDRRPLGVGSGPAAILAALDDLEVERILRDTAQGRAKYGLSVSDVRAILREARAAGFAFVDGKIVPGICTVGVAIPLSDGTPIGSISVSAIRDRMDDHRRREIAMALREEIERLKIEWSGILSAGNGRRLTKASLGGRS